MAGISRKLSVDKRAKSEDKGLPRQEVKAAREKSSEKPRDADMGHAKRAAEHMAKAEMHHKEAKKAMAKCK